MKIMTYTPSIYPRTLYLVWAFCTLGLAVTSPTSLTAVLALKSGGVGGLGVIVFSTSCFVLLADLVINDLLPDKYELQFAREYRWLCVSSVAIVYWLFGTMALLPGTSPQGSWVLIAAYFAIGAWGMTFAFATKVARYRNQLAAHEHAV